MTMPDPSSRSAASVNQYSDSPSSGSPLPDGDAATPTRDQLLAEVLGETLSRGREDPHGLIRSIREWKATLPRSSDGGPAILDAQQMPDLVGVILRQRLGDKSDRLPEKLRQDVADVLWNNPASRERIRRLWGSVDQTQ